MLPASKHYSKCNMETKTAKVLIVDIGSGSIRIFLLDTNGEMTLRTRERLHSQYSKGNEVLIDVSGFSNMLTECMTQILNDSGYVDAVAITNQRASTVIYDNSLRPLHRAISWQDFRTIGRCMVLAQQNIRLAPNQSATKIEFLLDTLDRNRVDTKSYKVGTLDNYVAAILSGGDLHITDLSNASLSGLIKRDLGAYDESILEALRIPLEVLPVIGDSIGILGHASALPGSPPIAAMLGDQQASMIGQGCITTGQMKVTFGTGAMADINTGTASLYKDLLGPNGCTEIVAYKTPDACAYAIEAIGLSAGSAIEWLCGTLGIADNPSQLEAMAASVNDSGGVCFVPAQYGLGTPTWDFGAKALFSGIGTNTTKPEIARAVLEGIANVGTELIEAASAEAGTSENSSPIKVDGGMTTNRTFLQLLANMTSREIHVAKYAEATSYGAGLAALTAIGAYEDLSDAVSDYRPSLVIPPTKRHDRKRWLEAKERARNNVPALSAIKF